MGRFAAKIAASKPTLLVIVVSLLLGAGPFNLRVRAAEPEPRSLTTSNSFAGSAGVSYRAQFKFATTGTVGSISILFCENTALVDLPCDPPSGFDATNAVNSLQLGQVGFVLSPSSTANNIILSRPPATANAGDVGVYDFNNITNPTNPGPMYARFLTYSTSDASGPYTDAGGMALYFQNSVDINAEVPPYLLFCLGENISGLDCNTATEPFSDLGSLKPSLTAAAQHQLLVATNASNGYSMWVQGSSMTSGSDVITPMAGGASQKGVSQFGINLRANTTPNIGQDPSGPGSGTAVAGYNLQNQFRFQSGDTLASSALPDDYRKYTVSYIVNVPSGQPGGVYSTTLIYVCLANF